MRFGVPSLKQLASKVLFGFRWLDLGRWKVGLQPFPPSVPHSAWLAVGSISGLSFLLPWRFAQLGGGLVWLGVPGRQLGPGARRLERVRVRLLIRPLRRRLLRRLRFGKALRQLVPQFRGHPSGSLVWLPSSHPGRSFEGLPVDIFANGCTHTFRGA